MTTNDTKVIDQVAVRPGMRLVDKGWPEGRVASTVYFLVSGRENEVTVVLSQGHVWVETADFTGRAEYAVEPRPMTEDDDPMVLLAQFARRPVEPSQVTWWVIFQDGREWPATTPVGSVEVITEGG